jgi:predicted nucleic acid-binding Zn ribbon protein
MKRINEQSLGDSLQQYLHDNRLKGKTDEYKLLSKWDTMVGGFIAKHTDRLYTSGKKLYVRVESSAVRHELMMNREKVIELVNAEMGRDFVNDLVLL